MTGRRKDCLPATTNNHALFYIVHTVPVKRLDGHFTVQNTGQAE